MNPPLGAGGRLAVRPKPEILTFHLHMGSLVHPTNRDRFSACASVRIGFRAFFGERMEGIAWNCACWRILTTFRTDYIMVTVYWFSSLWRHFYLVKRVKFGVSGNFSENAWREWPGIVHTGVSSQTSEVIRLWSQFVNFSNFWHYFDLVK